MLNRRNCHSLVCLLFAVLLGAQVWAQVIVTGTITGTVTDPSGLAVAGAKVTLTGEQTGDVRTAVTNELGIVTFAALQPGAYSVKVEQSGFKGFERTGIMLSASELLPLGEIKLEIGAVTETIRVESQGAVVETASSGQSAMITSSQIDSIQVIGRDVMSFLRMLPGSQYIADGASVSGGGGSNSPRMGGAFSSANLMTVDGVVGNDFGATSYLSGVPPMDALGEVKVIMNAYQAEYAGNGGAVVELITKSGGREYHGSGYYFVRNEDFNANNFFNNRNGVANPRYRYNTLGFNLGGPIYIPGKFNRSKNLLFGFYNLENWGISYPNGLSLYTMPTALERAGNYSQTVDVSGKLIPITDPTTHQPFAGNIIPASRLNPNGQALLNILPLPNFTNRAITGGNYNYQISPVLKQPKRFQQFKIDVVPREKDTFYVRGKTMLSQQETSGANPVGLYWQCYCFTESGIGAGWTHIFTPAIVMEVTGGIRHYHENWPPSGPWGPSDVANVLRSTAGFNAGQWYPQSNSQGIIPQYSFGGVPDAPNVSYDPRLLQGGNETSISFNDTVTIIHGPHTFKAGTSFLAIRQFKSHQSNFAGTFSFARDVNNPYDTNWAFSNAVLGIFDTYSEANSRPAPNVRQKIAEWFVQDGWKVNRKLTLQYGIRFSWYNQNFDPYAGAESELALGRYSASQVPLFYRPALNNGVRMAQDPVTGAFLPAAYIGAFVPGTGNPAPGGVLSGDPSYPRGFINQQPVLYGPRLGFAYDPFGKGKTAIRGSAAILYDLHINKFNSTNGVPPAVFNPTTYYGNLDTFLQTGNVLSPSNTSAWDVNNKTPSVTNLSLGVQQDIGFKTLIEVSYLGALGRHLLQTSNLNTLPYGAHFLPQNADPTNPGKPLPDNMLRPLPGYATITYYADAYTSNYNGLLVSLNRRFAKGVQVGLAYTYSKFMDYTSIPIYMPRRVWSYGKDPSDQTHNMVINFTWDVPKASRLLPNPVVRHVLDNWQLSGVTTFCSGQPSGVSYGTTDGADITGGGDGARIIVTGKAPLDFGDRSFYQWFNTSVFARPPQGSPGNAPKDVFRLPGVNNWDLSLVKKFPLRSEKRFFQFRWEAYNAFNHTQYSGVNTSASFNPQGQQVNALFGQVTSARPPRVMQGSLRLTF